MVYDDWNPDDDDVWWCMDGDGGDDGFLLSFDDPDDVAEPMMM